MTHIATNGQSTPFIATNNLQLLQQHIASLLLLWQSMATVGPVYSCYSNQCPVIKLVTDNKLWLSPSCLYLPGLLGTGSLMPVGFYDSAAENEIPWQSLWPTSLLLCPVDVLHYVPLIIYCTARYGYIPYWKLFKKIAHWCCNSVHVFK